MRLAAGLPSMAAIMALVAAITATQPAVAQEECDDLGEKTAIQACLVAAQKSAEIRLADAYRATLQRFQVLDKANRNANFAAKLAAGQKAWLQYRDADCETEAVVSAYEGSDAAGARLGCVVGMDERRIDELVAWTEAKP